MPRVLADAPGALPQPLQLPPPPSPHASSTLSLSSTSCSASNDIGGPPLGNDSSTTVILNHGAPDDNAPDYGGSLQTTLGEAGPPTDGRDNWPDVLGTDTPSESPDGGFVTARFRHVMTDDGHAIITGHDGILQRCEDEPIHTPGAVQAFGLLVALREEADGRFAVRVVSENSKEIIGYSPSELFNLESFTDIFSDEQADNLLDHIDFIRDEDSDPATSGPDVFSIAIRPPESKPVKL